MKPRRISASRIALVYAIGAALWIIFSDRLVGAIGIPELQTYKGLAFVAISAGLLYAYLARALAAQRKAENAAQRANESRARMVAAVSHDLRQPLQSLALFAAVIEADPTLSQRARQAVTNLAKSVEGMGALLNAILDLARLDQGVEVPAPRPVALAPLLSALAEEMRPQAEAKGLRLLVMAPDAAVLSDTTLLQTILRNLVANAIRYTGQGGVLIGCRRRGKDCMLAVYDTGPGIAADKIDLIFEEFYQVENPARDSRLGLGLGLSIVERLSRQLGHRLVIRSVVGRGSCFGVMVPRAP